jgi:hypothetical protein
MSDTFRWKYGDYYPVVAAVDSATVIELGDLLWQDIDNAKPASELANPGTFTLNFLGVAMERNRKGDTTAIRVATSGVFEFDVLAGECFELGDLVGVRCITAVRLGDSEVKEHKVQELENQVVAKVTNSKLAIGRVDKREPRAAESVLVRIQSRVFGPII